MSGRRDTRGQHRRFSIVSRFLTRSLIIDSLTHSNVKRFVGAVQDKDPGVAAHGHAIVELKSARTGATVAGYFRVPVIVKPIVGSKGDPWSFARAVRYSTHEAPREQAAGKYRYSDDEIFSSPGYDWRAEVDALTAREGYRLPKLDQYLLDLTTGEIEPSDVYDSDPLLFMRQHSRLQSAYNRGVEMRRRIPKREKERAALRRVMDLVPEILAGRLVARDVNLEGFRGLTPTDRERGFEALSTAQARHDRAMRRLVALTRPVPVAQREPAGEPARPSASPLAASLWDDNQLDLAGRALPGESATRVFARAL